MASGAISKPQPHSTMHLPASSDFSFMSFVYFVVHPRSFRQMDNPMRKPV
jgi:hypothetical protein